MKPVENRGYIEQPISMSCTVIFSVLCVFAGTGKVDRITKIRELKLKKKSQAEGQTEATFVMSIFFQKSAA